MRASATSRAHSPANIPAAQAKADANKADAASPFALLVEMASAKDPTKPAKKDTRDSGDKPASDSIKQADGNVVKQDDSTAAAPTAPSPKTAAKPGKPDKAKDDGAIQTDQSETAPSAADDRQIAAIEQQMADQQALPPAPAPTVQASTPADTDTDAPEDIRIAAPVAKAAAPSPNLDMPQPDSVNGAPKTGETTPIQAAPQTQSSVPQPDESQVEDSETAETVAASPTQAAPADVKPAPKDTGKPAAVKIASKNEAPATAKPQSAAVERGDSAQTGSIQDGDEPVRSVQAKAGKPGPVKDDNSADMPLKGHAIRAANVAKADTDTSGIPKADAPQADVPATDSDTAAAAPLPKPVPQSAAVSNAGFAINNIAAPQAVQHSQAPIATQHIQVTAQPAPNLPALAVEIAAKSQSGAKQFDIRLDPPELGRVEVRLSIDPAGKASAHLSADQPQTLALLQKDAPVLTRALREAGLDVSQDGLNFSLRQQTQNGNDSNHSRFGSARSFSLAATASVDPGAAAIAYRGVVDGRLDIRV